MIMLIFPKDTVKQVDRTVSDAAVSGIEAGGKAPSSRHHTMLSFLSSHLESG